MAFLWRHEGTNLTRTTTGSLIIPHVTLNDAGNYTVAVTNFAGAITSAPVLLTLANAAVFTPLWPSRPLQTGDPLVFRLQTPPGMIFQIDESLDLKLWTPSVKTNSNGGEFAVRVVPAPAPSQHYYRAKLVAP